MRFIGLDLETAGIDDAYALQPFRAAFKPRQSWITSIAAIDDEGNGISYLKPTDNEILHVINYITDQCFVDKTLLVCGWNFVFDLAWLIAYGHLDDIKQWNIYDGYVAYRQIHNQPFKGSYGLKHAVSEKWPELKGYDSEIDFRVINEALHEYNRRDAYFTALLCKDMVNQQTVKQNNLCRIVSEASKPFAESWIRGVTINRKNLEKLSTATIDEHDSHLGAILMEDDVLRSPKKLKTWIHDNLEIDIDSTAKSTLSKYATPEMVSIREAKRTGTLISRVINAANEALAYVNKQPAKPTGPVRGRKPKTDRAVTLSRRSSLYPQPRMFNTYTGRVGYESKILRKHPVSIALHQMPRNLACRSIIEAPKGYKIVEFDFAGQEARLIADFSGDVQMVNAFNNGLDLHSLMGATLTGMDYDEFIAKLKNGDKEIKQQRLLGKIANLALQYRMSVNKLVETARVQNGLDITETQASNIHRRYRELYPGVVVYWRKAIEAGVTKGYAETKGGRRVTLDFRDKKVGYMSEQTAINFPIQGTGADMKYLALTLLYEQVMPRYVNLKFMFDLHDGLFFLMPNKIIDKAVPEFIQAFNKLPYQLVFKWRPKVAFPVDCKIGQNWGEMKEYG